MGLGRFGRACGFGVGDMASVRLLAAFKIQILTTVCKWPIPADCMRRLRYGAKRQNHFGQPSSMRFRTMPEARNPPSHNSNRTPGCKTSPKSSAQLRNIER